MAKLGEFEYPEIGLDESIGLGRKIAREYAGEISRQGLARTLGMSERGGAFSARLGALRMWGVAAGRSRIRVTRDGLRAVTPLSAKEAEDAKETLANNVALFNSLAQRLGSEPYAPEQLAVVLEELTGADRAEVTRRFALLDRLFGEVRGFLQTDSLFAEQPQVHKSVSEAAVAGQEPVRRTESSTKPTIAEGTDVQPGQAVDLVDRIELKLPDGTISLPETLANLDAALTILWARRQLVAALQAAEGKPAPEPPRNFAPAKSPE